MKQSVTIIFLLFLMPVIAWACPVPVFQYALEFWEADPYRLTVFHEEDLTFEQQEMITYLDNAENANIDVRVVDVEEDIDDMTRTFYDEQEPDELPWMVLQYPEISWKNTPVWSGRLVDENVHKILDSPVRRQISDYLVSEQTAVWVLLESGNRSKDANALELLENELNRLEQTLQLPDPELWWEGDSELGKDDLPEVKFQTVTLSENDPAEGIFKKMLMHIEEDLEEFSDEPIVIPVYGRGIALWAIAGSGINEWNIGEAAEFLTGPCSCQVKMLNPGVDILIDKDWESQIKRVTADITTPLTGMSDFGDREEEARRQLEEQLGYQEQQIEEPGRDETDDDNVVYIDLDFGDREAEEVAPEETSTSLEPDDEQRDISRYLVGGFIILFIFIMGLGLILMKIMAKKEGR